MISCAECKENMLPFLVLGYTVLLYVKDDEDLHLYSPHAQGRSNE